MSSNATKLAQSCQEKFALGAKELNSRRRNWADNADLIKTIFQSFAEGIDWPSAYKWLSIVDSRELDIQKDSLRFISIEWTPQPVGLKAIGNPNKLEIEIGARLSIVQIVTGKILCVIYPAKSEMLKANEDRLLIKGPFDIESLTEKKLLKMLRIFVAYSQVTSFIGAPTWQDHLIVMYQRLKTKFRNKDKMEIFGAAIKKMSSVLSKIITGA